MLPSALPSLARRAARASFPVMKATVFRYYRIDPAMVKRAQEQFDAVCRRWASERGSRDYLVGERFSVADLTFCALVGPLVAPPEFPFDFPAGLGELTAEARATLERHGAMEWVLEMYRRHRGAWVPATR